MIKISKKRLDELADPHLRALNPPSDNEIAELVRAVAATACDDERDKFVQRIELFLAVDRPRGDFDRQVYETARAALLVDVAGHVRKALAKASCPDAYMRIAVDACREAQQKFYKGGKV